MLYVCVSVQLYEQEILLWEIYVITGYTDQPATVVVVSTMRLGGPNPIGYQLVITSPDVHPNKDERTTDSCFALMRVHQSCLPLDGRMT